MSKQNLGFEKGPSDLDVQMRPQAEYRTVPYDERYGAQQQPRMRYSGANKDVIEAVEFVKYLFFAFNLFFFLCACSVLGVSIWIAVDRSFMATITGEPLYAVAAYLMIAGGAIMFILAFLGCCGAVVENKTMLWIYFVAMALILLLLFIGAILAIVFRAQIGTAVQDTMEETLVEYYGVELYERKNDAITDAWDKAQERLYCCSVTNNSWAIYRESKWFANQPWNPEDKKPYVPKSCCVRDRFDRYVDTDTCQKWDLGPPKQQSGAINRALYYEGCYEAGLRYLSENSDILIGIGIGFLVIVIMGLVLSFVLIRKLPDNKDR